MSQTYNNSCPYDHACVAYGYREILVGATLDTAYYFVHTGWKSPNNLGSFSCDWFFGGLYIY